MPIQFQKVGVCFFFAFGTSQFDVNIEKHIHNKCDTEVGEIAYGREITNM